MVKINKEEKKVDKKVDKKSEEKVEKAVEPVEDIKPVEHKKVEGRVVKKDINLTYRKGDLVPEHQIKQWEKNGLDMEEYLE